MNRNLKRLIRKKGRRFKKAKNSGIDEDRARYIVKRELRDAERVYVNGIESWNNKPFWKYVKSQKQETFSISALKSNGTVITDSLLKAEIFNLFSLPNLEIHFPSCRVLNSPKFNLYIFLRMVFSCY